MNIKKDVRWFADIMEMELQNNQDKGDWGKCSYGFLLKSAIKNIFQVDEALKESNIPLSIIKSCADVANFMMMIADKFNQSTVRRSEIASLLIVFDINKCKPQGRSMTFYAWDDVSKTKEEK